MVESAAAHKSFAELIAGDELVLINFYADWTEACNEVKSILERVRSKMKNEVIFLKIDVNKNPKLTRLYSIQSAPTLMLFKKNQILWKQAGVTPSQVIEKILQENL